MQLTGDPSCDSPALQTDGCPCERRAPPLLPFAPEGSGQVPVSPAGAAFLSRRNPSSSALGQAEQGAGSLPPWPVDGRGGSLPGVAPPREELEELKPQDTLWSPETGPSPGERTRKASPLGPWEPGTQAGRPPEENAICLDGREQGLPLNPGDALHSVSGPGPAQGTWLSVQLPPCVCRLSSRSPGVVAEVCEPRVSSCLLPRPPGQRAVQAALRGPSEDHPLQPPAPLGECAESPVSFSPTAESEAQRSVGEESIRSPFLPRAAPVHGSVLGEPHRAAAEQTRFPAESVCPSVRGAGSRTGCLQDLTK